MAYIEYNGLKGHDYPLKLYPEIKEWHEPVLIYRLMGDEIYYRKSKTI